MLIVPVGVTMRVAVTMMDIDSGLFREGVADGFAVEGADRRRAGGCC